MRYLFLRIYYCITETYQDLRVRVGLPNNCNHDYHMVVMGGDGELYEYCVFRCIKCGHVDL